MMRIFSDAKTGLTIIISKQKNESYEQFCGRGYFMLKYKKYYNEEINELIKMSQLWKNIKYLHCEYPSKIMKKIMDVK
jgi:hypothetical protein